MWGSQCVRILSQFHFNLVTLCASSRCDFILYFWFFLALKNSQTFPANGIDHPERLWWPNQEHLFSVAGGKIFVGRRRQAGRCWICHAASTLGLVRPPWKKSRKTTSVVFAVDFLMTHLINALSCLWPKPL